jgi:hypothetical protein
MARVISVHFVCGAVQQIKEGDVRRFKDLDNRLTRRHMVISQPTSIGHIRFDDLYEEISDHWLDRARKLQARRWRRLKNQLV